MSHYLGYGLFALLILLWLRSQWREDDLFGKDECGYSDPGKPRPVSQQRPASALRVASDLPRAQVADAVPRVIASEYQGSTRISLVEKNDKTFTR